MNIRKIYKHHLSVNNNKNAALGNAIEEISKIIDNSNIDEEFMKEYYKAKKRSIILNIISPGIIFGLSTGAIISFIDLNVQITNICVFLFYYIYVLVYLIVGTTLCCFIPILIYGKRVNSVLLPHQIRRMELRIDDHYKKASYNNKK